MPGAPVLLANDAPVGILGKGTKVTASPMDGSSTLRGTSARITVAWSGSALTTGSRVGGTLRRQCIQEWLWVWHER